MNLKEYKRLYDVRCKRSPHYITHYPTFEVWVEKEIPSLEESIKCLEDDCKASVQSLRDLQEMLRKYLSVSVDYIKELKDE